MFPEVALVIGFVSFAKSAKKRSFFEIIPRPVIGLQPVVGGTSIDLPKKVAARVGIVCDVWIEIESVYLSATLAEVLF